MQSGKFLVMAACVAVAVSAPPMAHSDGPCNKGFRDSTPAERATMTTVLQVAKKALPPAPTGWVILGDDQISVTTSLCRDYEGAPWSYDFNRSYQRVDDQEARNKIIADAAAASQAALALKQPRLDAAMAKMEKIVAKQVALVEKGDMAGAQAINEEMAKAQEDYQKIMDEGDSQAQMNTSLAKASRDQSMFINVVVNSNQEVPDASAKKIPLPPGALAAFRWDTSRDQVPSETCADSCRPMASQPGWRPGSVFSTQPWRPLPPRSCRSASRLIRTAWLGSLGRSTSKVWQRKSRTSERLPDRPAIALPCCGDLVYRDVAHDAIFVARDVDERARCLEGCAVRQEQRSARIRTRPSCRAKAPGACDARSGDARPSKNYFLQIDLATEFEWLADRLSYRSADREPNSHPFRATRCTKSRSSQ